MHFSLVIESSSILLSSMVTAVQMAAPVLENTMPVLELVYPVHSDMDPAYVDNMQNVGLRKNPLYILGWRARKGQCK
jgi:hypothetical protein